LTEEMNNAMDLQNERSARFLFRHRKLLTAVFQCALVFTSLVLSWALRFDFVLRNPRLLLKSAALLVIIRLLPIAYFGLLRGWWRYVGIYDAFVVAEAVGSGSILFWLINRYVLHQASFPRSVYVLESILTFGILLSVRVAWRSLKESSGTREHGKCNVILIGAGSAARIILREINQRSSGYLALGCLDDDASKHGIYIEGVPVLGSIDSLPVVLQSKAVDEVLIAVPSARSEEMQRIFDICNQAKIKFRTIPAIKDIIAGQVSISQLREVSLEDLLSREPTHIDLESVKRQIAGRAILVTGAAGSIGSELCQQILDCDPAQLICFDQSETGLFYRQLELSKHRNGRSVKYCVADVNDTEGVRWILREYIPDVIFHVAAYKHVPMMEQNVHEAVKNNVFALVKLLDLAEASGCMNFVFISSDKAVNPSSVMGATKRIGELILAARPSKGMRAVAVRFGNVLGSSGSVVPVMLEQLRNGQPLTVTHPEIRRYFMTIREAVELVLQAFVVGSHGDILVLEMGRSVKILDLARNLIRLAGKSENESSIRFTGLRAGEKLEEELFYAHEEVLPTQCHEVRKAKCQLPQWPELQRHLAELRLSMSIDGAAPIRAKIKEIVPEFSQCELLAPQEPAKSLVEIVGRSNGHEKARTGIP
jgi:FlaA1/EpsC-like NDP-sugar epimerase